MYNRPIPPEDFIPKPDEYNFNWCYQVHSRRTSPLGVTIRAKGPRADAFDSLILSLSLQMHLPLMDNSECTFFTTATVDRFRYKDWWKLIKLLQFPRDFPETSFPPPEQVANDWLHFSCTGIYIMIFQEAKTSPTCWTQWSKAKLDYVE